MSKQTLGLVGAASLIAGWMLASTASPPVAQTQAGPVRRPAPAVPVTAVPTFDTLQKRMDALPPAPQPQRNPFAFEGRRPDARALAPDAAGEWMPEPDRTPPPPAPVVHLVGVAGDLTDAGFVRTAILSDGRDMWMLKAGDALPDGRTIVRVDDEAVVLVDGTGAERVLRLR